MWCDFFALMVVCLFVFLRCVFPEIWAQTLVYPPSLWSRLRHSLLLSAQKGRRSAEQVKRLIHGHTLTLKQHHFNAQWQSVKWQMNLWCERFIQIWIFQHWLLSPQWSQEGTVVRLFMNLALCPTHCFRLQWSCFESLWIHLFLS